MPPLTAGHVAGLLGPGGAPIELPVTIRVGDGEPVEIGRLDVTIGATCAPDPDEPNAIRVSVALAGEGTVNERLADLLDAAAAALRAPDHDEEVPGAAPR